MHLVPGSKWTHVSSGEVLIYTLKCEWYKGPIPKDSQCQDWLKDPDKAVGVGLNDEEAAAWLLAHDFTIPAELFSRFPLADSG